MKLLSRFSVRLLLTFLPFAALAPAAHTLTEYFWGGGSGLWSDAHWGRSPGDNPTRTFSAGGAGFGYQGPSGTVSLTSNVSLISLDFVATNSFDFTLALAGHSFTDSTYFHTENGALDFAGGDGSFAWNGSDSANLTLTSLTIVNFDVGYDSLRLGANGSVLTPTDLSHVIFSGYTLAGAAQIDANGFVTPAGQLISVPETSTFAAWMGAAVLAVGLVWRRRRAASARA